MAVNPITLAITLALNAATMAMGMMRKIEGPRVKDLAVSTADYGTPHNYFRGRRRVECACFWAEKLKEVKKKRKTKGGKYNEYRYYGTFAMMICDHEVQQITKIWADRHLIYDVTGKGVVTAIGENDINGNAAFWRFYTGTEDQLPDDRMVATDTAKWGAGTTPAYRGRTWIMFIDIPLEKVGNRLPQISAEAITSANTVYPYDEFTVMTAQTVTFGGVAFSSDYRYFVWLAGNYFEVWDNVAKVPLNWGLLPATTSFNIVGGITNAGAYIFVTSDGIVQLTVDGHYAVVYQADVASPQSVQVIMDGDGVEWIFAQPFSTTGYYTLLEIQSYYSNGVPAMEVNPGFQMYFAFRDTHGDIWGIGSPYVSGTDEVIFTPLVVTSGRSVANFTVATGVPVSGTLHSAQALSYGTDFILLWAGTLFRIDEDTHAITQIGSVTTTANLDAAFAMHSPQKETIWFGFQEFSLSDFSLIRTMDPFDWIDGGPTGATLYDPLNNAIINMAPFDPLLRWYYLDRPSSDGETLGSIVDFVAGLCGMDANDIDSSDLTDLVAGYSWTQGSGRDILAPLLDYHDSFARPHDFKLQFLRRGAAPTGTLTSDMMVPEERGEVYQITSVNDTDLPRRAYITFADLDGDQQPNTAVAQRSAEAMDSQRELSIDLTTMAGTATDVQQRAERFMRRRWYATTGITCSFTAQSIGLEPGDFKTLDLDGDLINARLLRLTIGADDILKTEWERDAASLHTLSTITGAALEGRVPSSIDAPVMTKAWVLDMPLLLDSDEQGSPLLYVAAAPYVDNDNTAWFGADFWVSSTGAIDDYAAGWESISSANGSTWGLVDGTLAAAIPEVIDEASVLTVVMRSGTLQSITQEQFDGSLSLNMMIVGSEVIQFRDAVLTHDGIYELSYFRRGCRGTEQYTTTHVRGETALLVSGLIVRHDMAAGDVGSIAYYRGAGQGMSPSEGFEIRVDFAGASHKPLSPAMVTLRHASSGGDWRITAIRRTRFGGNLIDGRDVPVGEPSELYQCDIMDGTAVTRTIEASSLDFTYTTAEQTADFGSPQATLSVKVRQLSPALGIAGYDATASA